MRRAVFYLAGLGTLCFFFGIAAQSGPLQKSTEAESPSVRQLPDGSAPNLVQFSGALRGSTGRPMIDVLGLTFALYKEQQGGVPLWLETQNIEADAGGNYAVLLGAASEGMPVELFRTGEARWLGVRVVGEEEAPRLLLVSVPYALKAADADTLGGKPLSSFVLNDGDMTSSLDRSSLNSADVPRVDGISGTGTTNMLAKWLDNAGTLGDSIVTENNGNIGLSSTSPQVSLDVTGTVRAVTSPAAPFGTYLMPNGGAANSFRLGFGNNLPSANSPIP